MVDGGTSEIFRQGVVCKHVVDRVWLALDPELIHELAVALGGEWLGLACVGDDAVVIWSGDWTVTSLDVQLPGEEICVDGVSNVNVRNLASMLLTIPRFVSVVLC